MPRPTLSMPFTIDNPLCERIKLKHRYYIDEDYAQISEWWQSWDWDCLPKYCLPSIGIIVSNGDVDICVAFLYKTDSAICWAEHFTANRTAPKELRAGAIEYLINTLADEAKDNGFAIMMSSVQHQGLIKKLIANGYAEKYEKNMNNLMRIL